MNLCPCRYYGDALVTKYQKRISGPLLDRIDIHIEVPRVDYEKLSGDRMAETSESFRARVQAARDIQRKRFSSSNSDVICNAYMLVGEIRQFCKLQDEGQSLMSAVMSSSICRRALIIVSSNWRVQLRTWLEVKKYSHRIWLRLCNTVRS